MDKIIIKCDNCGKEMPMSSLSQKGDYSIKCLKCKAKIKFHFNGEVVEILECEKKEIPTPKQKVEVQKGEEPSSQSSPTKKTDPRNTSMGKLTLVRFHGLLGKKTYRLHLGQNTIGRYDPNLSCDIEIKNDNYMSRRSVVIDVIQTEKGYLFKMTVLNAANPVLLNNKPLVVGECPYLNYGDSITLGNTTFNFEKE